MKPWVFPLVPLSGTTAGITAREMEGRNVRAVRMVWRGGMVRVDDDSGCDSS